MDQIALARQRDENNLCVTCGSSQGERRLGLCSRCYTVYRRSRDRLPEHRRDEYTQLLIDRGYLMPSRQGRRLDKPISPFEAFADVFTHAKDSELAEQADRVAEDLEQFCPQNKGSTERKKTAKRKSS